MKPNEIKQNQVTSIIINYNQLHRPRHCQTFGRIGSGTAQHVDEKSVEIVVQAALRHHDQTPVFLFVHVQKTR